MPKDLEVSDIYGNTHRATEVDVVKIIPGKTVLHLEDGTVLSLNVTPLQVTRVVDRWDPFGFPLYNVSNQVVFQILDCDNGLRQKGT